MYIIYILYYFPLSGYLPVLVLSPMCLSLITALLDYVTITIFISVNMSNMLKLLQGLAREIKVSSTNVSIITCPSLFKSTLTDLSEGVQKKAIISTLYIGNGPNEKKIISNLASAAGRGCDVNIMMDRHRGCRDRGRVLKPLQRKANIHLFRTPHTEKNLLPGQVRECFGVHHIKFYLFDDTVVLSGANMSELYFEKRQDRYVVIKSQQLANFLESWHDIYSYVGVKWEPLTKPNDGWVWTDHKKAQAAIDTWEYITPFPRSKPDSVSDTSVFPLFQMWWNHVYQADDALETLLRNNNSPITLASGYFNPTKTFTELISHAKYPVEIIIPSNKANGFYSGSGVKALVPKMYNNAAAQFLKECPNVTVRQYDREKWSFHGKGLWADNLTIIGSSNFSKRSCFRDAELLFGIITDSSDLKDKFAEEKEALLGHSSPFTIDYHFMIPRIGKIFSSFL